MIQRSQPIREFMTPAPLTVEDDLPLADARDRMARSRVRHLPVVRDGALVGILSARDLLMMEDLSASAMSSMTVDAAMTANPHRVGPDEPLGDVVRAMVQHDVGAVLVVEGEKVVGIFTDVDAVHLLDRALIP